MDSIFVEKVGVKSIFSVLKDIIVGNNSDQEEEKINKSLKEIYLVQKEIGATESISSFEKDMQRLPSMEIDGEKKKRSKLDKNNAQKVNNIQKFSEKTDSIDKDDNFLDL